jgi:flavodoxin
MFLSLIRVDGVMKIGIVYYSRTGNTRQAAKMVEEKLKQKKADVDLIEIEHVKRPGFFTAGRASSKQLELPVKNTQFDLGNYDVIIAGTPTWAGKPSPFITYFIKKAVNIKGKKVAVFGTGMSPIDKRDQFTTIMRTTLNQAGVKMFDAPLTLQFGRGSLKDGGQNIDSFVDAVLKMK